ncbi:GCN5-related N-acetyltransferase [Alteracholeplasma palmae J233]|uniref:GCN5-related N-acetyltransferase n=1 Tax=Alteracholeplasma palmae (strain ATCC 49389 / J233) TaxID=1318466 RepID=U4KL00_ALTPJ|nr:GNAT family N-acetyltransferase [Alteracholeplasma palmae]CCV64388.1 GCN5-related N-acetyltransferase [Alteracholeplasma palmae J233]
MIKNIPMNTRIDFVNKLLTIWENSVRETHHFLSEKNLIAIKAEVNDALMSIENLFVFLKENEMLGFIGVENRKIEMLFIDTMFRNQGIGKKLVDFSIKNLNVKYVDVNEQNHQALDFYLKIGFEIKSRLELDSQGRNYPLLHLHYYED